ncbi:hypothetical protein [Chamaesiphon sp. VAR_48_metabat_403]|uniref:hypothetical protein n=1 Tax=Chamaesiphon sp. VAR_48_metabat_403 TaxID=2964700 RepID=UPI00286DEE3A|nr:hypothetical protein [Chamaesiphon sp. VAR_48_metabat_403]
MDYSNIEIEVKNIPRIESLGDGRCYRKYFYQFVNTLPAQNRLNLQAKELDYKFTYSKEEYDLAEDGDVYALVSVERLNDLAAIFIVSTEEPEEDAIFIYGLISLPRKIETIFGIIESIQGDSRNMWIKSYIR